MNNLKGLIIIFLISVPGLAQNWVQLGQDIIGENSGDNFGDQISLSHDGNRIAICGFNNGNARGHLRIYENQSGNWVQLGQDIDGTDAGDQLGISIQINDEGTRVITSSRFQFTDSSGVIWGDARVFEYQNNIWVPMGDFITGPPNQSEPFAFVVSMNASGNIVAASSRAWQGFSGLTRVYEFNNGVWTQLGNDIVGNPGEVTGAGISLNATGNRIAVGGPGNDEGGLENRGIVRIFELAGGTWVQLGQGITGEAAFDEIGEPFDLNDVGDRIIIGEPDNDDVAPNSGKARVFELQSGSWIQLGSTFRGTQQADALGWEVSINSEGNRMSFIKILDNLSNNHVGVVAVYEYANGDWQQLFQELEGVEIGDGYGVNISLSGGGQHIATNAPAIGPGVAYVYVNDQILSSGNENDALKFLVYPNPNNGNFVIDLKAAYQNLTMNIYSFEGKLISTTEHNRVRRLSISQPLPSGIYFVQCISNDNINETIKIIIE